MVNLKQEKKRKEFIEKVNYYLHFFTKSFLFAVCAIIIVVGVFLLTYFGDLLYNVKSGNFKSPLFGAYIIITPSMVPTIKINDAVIIKRVSDNELKIGDIITFTSSDINHAGLTVTHRIVGKQLSQNGEYIYRTKGDNNFREDSALVKNDDVYGKVLFKIPKIGYLQKFVSTPFGFLICILVPALVVLVCDIYRIIKAMKFSEEII